jgi:uncharacterized protein YdeI (YjbR/CyaY-like superfamily)
MKPTFFENPAEFRKWLERHHQTAKELLVGFRRTKSGLPSMTWPESVEEALCFGWIDGIRKSLDENSYTIRFTPRKPTSTWSAINVRKVQELIDAGRMTDAGLKAWEERGKSTRFGYTYSDFDRELGEDERKEFEKDDEAWQFFQSQPPSYRRQVGYWVMSAKRPETKEKRLRQLIKASNDRRRVA